MADVLLNMSSLFTQHAFVYAHVVDRAKDVIRN